MFECTINNYNLHYVKLIKVTKFTYLLNLAKIYYL